MEQKENAILSIEHLNSWYEDEGAGFLKKGRRKQVLFDVSLTIGDDEFFGLVGESGCGKSTLANCVLGLQPFEGTVTLGGRARTKGDIRSFTRDVQAVFQDPLSALDPARTIGASLREPLVAHGIGSKQERDRRVADMLEAVGLDSTYMHRYPGELSGGQRQRVCIGAALMLQPRLLVADEAVSALDVSIQAQILNLFRGIDAGGDFSMLFISHNLHVVYYLCDRIGVMYRGRIVELGSAEDVVKDPRHPYTKLLLASIPGSGRAREEAEHRGEVPAGACPFWERCPVRRDACRTEPGLTPVDGTGHLAACHLAGTGA